MNWTELLRNEIETAYILTGRLMDMMSDEDLDWKPSTGNNWMTTGQLLRHLTEACGSPVRGFVTGDWGLPDNIKIEDLPPEEMLPPAEKMPGVASVTEARELLEKDRETALAMLNECTEDRLCSENICAPWSPVEKNLGFQILQMTEHLNQHRSQLFYYLKLQGKPVNTGHLWGM